MILWRSLVPVPPSTSNNIFVCTICTWLIFIVHRAYLLLSWLSFVWTSRPHLLCACCAWIIGYFFFQCWWIGCHIYFPKISFQDVQILSRICSSWYRTYVLALLNLYVVFQCCDCLIVFHVFFLIIRLILVVSYLIILFCFFIIINCDIIIICYVGLVINFLSVTPSLSSSLWLSVE